LAAVPSCRILATIDLDHARYWLATFYISQIASSYYLLVL
jgi:hypothetical protein